MISKEKLQETVNQLPDSIDLDELIERLVFLDKIEKGNNQSLLDDVVSEENLDENIEKWFE
ncbi:hypothetical protein [uncultured Flavobacterium sp.]|uniref:hypothetical protein n=1 Tax=uncultured Flavobacterium sp. TaxID=165435 RepID=UPI0030C8648E